MVKGGKIIKESSVVLRGGENLASGVAFQLHQVGIHIVITELAQPQAIRRLVSFSEAIYEGEVISD